MVRTEMHTMFWWGNLKEGENWENLRLDGNLKLISIAEKWDNMAWVLFVRFRVASGGTF